MRRSVRRRLWVALLCAASFVLQSSRFHHVEGDRGTLLVNGARRTYHVRLPKGGLQPGSPAVIALHGSRSTGVMMRSTTRWGALADQHGILMVFPDAGPGYDSWDVGWVAHHPDADPNPDVLFLRALIEELPVQYGVNPRRIYMCGMSIGGVMTGRMAGEASDLLAAVGIVSGTVGRKLHGRTLSPPRPESPIPVMTIHGGQDTGMPLAGGGDRQLWSLEECAGFWRRNDGIQDGRPTTFHGHGFVEQRWVGQQRRAEVVLQTLPWFGHGWPPNANTDLWAFFERHALP